MVAATLWIGARVSEDPAPHEGLFYVNSGHFVCGLRQSIRMRTFCFCVDCCLINQFFQGLLDVTVVSKLDLGGLALLEPMVCLVRWDLLWS